MRVTRLAAADEAGLFGDKSQVLLVPQPFGFPEVNCVANPAADALQ
jgi:hypothetical protein